MHGSSGGGIRPQEEAVYRTRPSGNPTPDLPVPEAQPDAGLPDVCYPCKSNLCRKVGAVAGGVEGCRPHLREIVEDTLYLLRWRIEEMEPADDVGDPVLVADLARLLDNRADPPSESSRLR